MTRMFSMVATCVAALAITSASAHAQRYELSLGTSVRWLGSSSMDALTDDNLAAFSLAGAIDIEHLHVAGFDVLLDGALETGAVSGATFQTMESETALSVATLGARMQRSLSDRWRVQGRAGLGGARVRVELSDRYAGSGMLTDQAWTPAAYLGAGTELVLARKRRPAGNLALGLRTELGYLATGSVDMSPRPPRDDDGVIRIPEMSTSLGGLDTGGWSLRFAVVGHF